MKLLYLLMLLSLFSCSPLRQVQVSQKADSTTVVQSNTRKMVDEFLREQGIITQTVIEFYPPAIKSLPIGDLLPEVIPRPQVKRITRSELNATTLKEYSTDSIVNNNIRTKTQRETEKKVIDKPPAAVSWIRWAVIALALIILLILLLKLL